ncbi:MAG: MaoC family dehydratase [Pararhodobacter sp.]
MIEARWTPTQAEFDAFAALSGDDNPIHTDPAHAARTRFGRTVSHGMLIFARFEALIAAHWPALRITAHEMIFPNPAYAGEELVLRVCAEGGTLILRATRAADGAACFEGRATHDSG